MTSHLPEMTSGAAQFGDPQLVLRNSPSDIMFDRPDKQNRTNTLNRQFDWSSKYIQVKQNVFQGRSKYSGIQTYDTIFDNLGILIQINNEII